MKKVAIITVNYNGEKDVIECLESLCKLDLSDIHLTIYIIDNHSTPAIVDSLENAIAKIPKKEQIQIELIKNY